MNTVLRLTTLLLFPALTPQVQAAEPQLPREGWVSWQVAIPDGAPAWCCWNSGRDRAGPSIPCALDNADTFGVGARDETTNTVKVYARSSSGKIDRLQVLAASCPVEAKTPVQELAGVQGDDSARWFIARVKEERGETAKHRSIGEHALAALALHPGAVASGALKGFARDPRIETRKSAVFWLAMLRGAEGADVASSVMFGDNDAEMRKHAAFAMAQTRSPRAAADLIRQGKTDKVADVRAQAWFWLAQTGADDAEREIVQALKKDSDKLVREQAIFALSQLPDERSTRALIAAAEDQSLDREQRRRAVFWLSQSRSDSAQAYLEKVLARNAN